MTDGETYLKENKDISLLIALIVSSIECLTCLLSLTVGIRLSYDAAHRKFRKKEGAFFVQILSEKEIVVVSKPPSSKQSGSGHDSVQSLNWTSFNRRRFLDNSQVDCSMKKKISRCKWKPEANDKSRFPFLSRRIFFFSVFLSKYFVFVRFQWDFLVGVLFYSISIYCTTSEN